MAQNLYTNLVIHSLSSDTQSLVVKSGATDIFSVNYNGRVGVGTSSPRAKFDINSTGQSIISGPNANTSSGYKYILEAEDNNGFLLGYNTVTGNDSRYQFDVFTNGSRFYIYDNNLTSGNHIKLDTRGSSNHTYFYLTGNTNFGINTTSPSAKLHTKGNTGLFIESDDAGYGSFKFRPYSSQQNYSSIQSADGDELRWGGAIGSPLNNGEFAFYNTANTNVKLAINHLNPTANLDIKGSRADSLGNTLSVQNSAGTNSLTVRDDGALLILTDVYTFSNYGQALFGGSVSSTNGQLTLRNSAGSSVANFQVLSSSLLFDSDNTLFRNSSGSITQMYKDGATGNFSIGYNHTSPSAKLDIKGSRADSLGNTLQVQNSAGTNTFLVRDDGIILAGNNTTWDGFSSVQFKKSGYIYQESPQGYKFNDNSGTGGFWGIQSPSNNLLTIERFGIGAPMMTFDSNLFKIGAFTSAPTAQLHLRNSTYTDGFRIESVNGTDLIFDSSGKLGINVSSPTEKIHISGGTIRIQTVNATEGAGKLAVSDANGSISFSSTTALGLSTSYGTVGGTGTAGYIAKWNSTTGLTNSLISESGTGVTVNGSIYIYGNVDVLGTATTFNTQTIQTADNNITLNMSGSYVTAYGGGITVLSGKSNGSSSTWSIDAAGNWSANTSAVTINGGRITSDGNVGLNNTFWAAASAPPVISVGTRNLFVGNNDTGTFTATGSFNNLLGSFQGVGLTSGVANTFIGTYNSIAGVTTGSYNIGINSNFPTNVSLALAIGSTAPQSNSVSIGSTGAWYGDWFLGLGKSATHAFGAVNMNWYASSVSEGDTDKAATIPIWRFNGSRATGSGSSGDIRFAVALSGASGALWNPLVDKLTVQGNSGFVGINQTNPTAQLHVTGNLKLENSSYGAGKIAVSDANGVISFSSTTSLGLGTGSVNKYSTSLTTPGANVTNTITHNLGTTDITVTLWLESTGDMTSAKVTNRQTNSVDVIFASAPGENVRVVVTG